MSTPSNVIVPPSGSETRPEKADADCVARLWEKNPPECVSVPVVPLNVAKAEPQQAEFPVTTGLVTLTPADAPVKNTAPPRVATLRSKLGLVPSVAVPKTYTPPPSPNTELDANVTGPGANSVPPASTYTPPPRCPSLDETSTPSRESVPEATYAPPPNEPVLVEMDPPVSVTEEEASRTIPPPAWGPEFPSTTT